MSRNRLEARVHLVDLGWGVARIEERFGFYKEDGEFDYYGYADCVGADAKFWQPIQMHIMAPSEEGTPAQSIYIGTQEGLKALGLKLTELFAQRDYKAE